MWTPPVLLLCIVHYYLISLALENTGLIAVS